MAFSQKQREYFDNANHRWNFKVGATRSGKTYMDYFMIMKRIRARIGKAGACVIMGVSQATIERNVLEPMREMYGESYVGRVGSANMCRLFGDNVYCIGAEKRNQVAKLRGMSIKYAYGDEATEWSPEVFELLKSRLDKPYSCFDGTSNPKGPNHWMKQFLDSDADIYCQKYQIFDNPFLTKEFIDNLCNEYRGTVYYNRYILGEWTLAEGIVYDMFSKDKHVVNSEDVELTKARYISCDYGTQNPTVFKKWAKGSDGIWYCIDEYYYSGRDTQRQKTDAEYVEDMKTFVADDRPKAIIVDPSAASFIEALRQAGFSVMKAKNDVSNGIREMAKALTTNKIKYTEKCPRTFDEFAAYSWDEKASERGEDIPIKDHDHCMDADRYFVYTILSQNKARIASKKQRGLR